MLVRDTNMCSNTYLTRTSKRKSWSILFFWQFSRAINVTSLMYILFHSSRYLRIISYPHYRTSIERFLYHLLLRNVQYLYDTLFGLSTRDTFHSACSLCGYKLRYVAGRWIESGEADVSYWSWKLLLSDRKWRISVFVSITLRDECKFPFIRIPLLQPLDGCHLVWPQNWPLILRKLSEAYRPKKPYTKRHVNSVDVIYELAHRILVAMQ